MSSGIDIDTAIAGGVSFLERAQLASGELPIFASTDPHMRDQCVLDPSVFPTALAAHSLSYCAAAAGICARARSFLTAEMDCHGLWRHWTRDHVHFEDLPPDLDDTSCASAALGRGGQDYPSNRAMLLANRNGRGLFYTWVTPRARLTPRPHMLLTLAQLRRAPTLIAFFRLTSAKPYDIDACVNANTIFYLGDFEGRDSVTRYLIGVLEAGEERQCDKWYDNPFVVRYFLSRALTVSACADVSAVIAERTVFEEAATSLDHALAAATLLDWGRDPDRHIEALLAGRQENGAWPRAALYHGGRARLRAGGYAPPHIDTPRWGSEATTTAFAIEALARSRSTRVP